MEIDVDCIVKSYGICKLCNHNVFEDKRHPAWMACCCPEPEVEKAEIKEQSPAYYDIDC